MARTKMTPVSADDVKKILEQMNIKIESKPKEVIKEAKNELQNQYNKTINIINVPETTKKRGRKPNPNKKEKVKSNKIEEISNVTKVKIDIPENINEGDQYEEIKDKDGNVVFYNNKIKSYSIKLKNRVNLVDLVNRIKLSGEVGIRPVDNGWLLSVTSYNNVHKKDMEEQLKLMGVL